MSDLFTKAAAAARAAEAPLADRMRPRTLDDVIGQDHIVGPGRLLRRAIQADRLSSVIFYGPPGTGKTSLARVIANTTLAAFESLNAVLAGVKDIREAIDRADERQRLYGKRTILFVDEVHRWNKAQQDALLPWVENGTVILVGATTENPFFEVNRALVSRSRIFQLKALTPADLRAAACRVLADRDRGYGKYCVTFEEGALEHLVEVASGDARSLLNALELAVETSEWEVGGEVSPLAPKPSIPALRASVPGFSAAPLSGGQPPQRPRANTADSHNENPVPGPRSPVPSSASPFPIPPSWPPPEGARIHITLEAAEESIQRRAVLYDRDGDYHFDTISAFIKSVRGSDPDAALYWMAKMVRAGEDPAFIFRRMIILASEDVGLADPHALEVVIACAEAFDRVGFPEGNFPLAHACLYLATAPKSNTTLGFFDALAEVDKEDAEVPNHLRDGSRDKEGFAHGEGYVYPHAYREHWTAQQYLPGSLQGKLFYTPSAVGYEAGIRAEVLRKRELQAAALLDPAAGSAADAESLTWSASSKGREGWFKRLESGRGRLLLANRDAIFAAASVSSGGGAWARHTRALVARANDGLLLWEALRRCPEGLAAAVVDSPAARDTLLRYAASFDETDAPRIAVCAGVLPTPAEAEAAFACAAFDCLLAREPWARQGAKRGTGDRAREAEAFFAEFARRAKALLVPGGRAVFLYTPPALGERISRILRGEYPSDGALPLSALESAETAFFAAHYPWGEADIRAAFEAAGFRVEIQTIEQAEERLLTGRDLAAWFDPGRSPWGEAVGAALGEEAFAAVRAALEERTRKGPLEWRWRSLLVRAAA